MNAERATSERGTDATSSDGETMARGIEAKAIQQGQAAKGEEVVKQQNPDAWEEEAKGGHTAKQQSKDVGPVRSGGNGVAGKKRWGRWNPLHRWLSDQPTPDFNLKI